MLKLLWSLVNLVILQQVNIRNFSLTRKKHQQNPLQQQAVPRLEKASGNMQDAFASAKKEHGIDRIQGF